MPHQIIEYSANLQDVLNIPQLVDVLHAEAAAQPELPLAGLRTRAHAAAHYRIADGHPDNAFVAAYLRVGEGRDQATLARIGTALASRLSDFVHRAAPGLPVALSYEVQEIRASLRWNDNTLREHLQRRQQQQ